MGQTSGKTGGKCQIPGLYVSGCCEKLVPFALDEAFSACCAQDTTWSFLQGASGASTASKAKRGPRMGGKVNGGGAGVAG
jgi:hypothetical protein